MYIIGPMPRTKNTHVNYFRTTSSGGSENSAATGGVECTADEREKSEISKSSQDVELINQLIKSKIEFSDICDELETMKHKLEDGGCDVCENDFSKFRRLQKQFTASINQFEILHGRVTMMHGLEVRDLQQMIESQRVEMQKDIEISTRHERVKTILNETIDIMERNKDNMFTTIGLLNDDLIETQDELVTAAVSADMVRDELNTLRYIIDTGKNPLSEKIICPATGSSLMPTDLVVVFSGSCSCNVMMKLSASQALVAEFYVKKQVSCMQCLLCM